jgi:hypothetical protein
MFIFFLLLFTFSTKAQDNIQPSKTNLVENGSVFLMFQIEDVQSGQSIWLERSKNFYYLLKLKTKSDEKTQKISSLEAKKLDFEFASRFFKCQYELPSSEEDCEVTLRLNLKGETQEICNKDERKTQEITLYLKNLEKHF